MVVCQDDAPTLTDCLDAIAEQRAPGVEVFVVDRASRDGSADVAIRHPAVDRVIPAARDGLQLVVDLASTEARRLVLIGADRRPRAGWLPAAVDGLRRAGVVHGPDRSLGNVAIDLTRLRHVRLLSGVDTLDGLIERAALAGACATEIAEMVVADAAPAPPPSRPLPVTSRPAPGPRWLGTISVVLCTRDRPAQLRRCLDSLARLDDDDHEILVVDNNGAPSLDVDALPPRARLLHEPRRGLDVARNRGATHAVGAVLAYVDDDCEVDPHWLTALRRAFADPAVGLVTGRVRPASLERSTHRSFESYFGFDRGLVRRRFTPWDDRPWYPLWTGLLGTGCNMAMRRSDLDRVGGFDERLDVGTTIGGGGDLDVFARLLQTGTIAEYAPDALVWHHHRDEPRDLARQFRGYGQASGAYLTKVAVEQPGMRGVALRCYVDRVARRLRVARSIRAGTHVISMRLLLTDLVGHLTGPALFLRSGRDPRRS
ncbi:MAG TPA: glycosyltransferase family 2 protein [Acidimicrobiales bacterium]|nr:glycosyltransferase family 2 protein [Acidimicrobiales bacterium]